MAGLRAYKARQRHGTISLGVTMKTGGVDEAPELGCRTKASLPELNSKKEDGWAKNEKPIKTTESREAAKRKKTVD